jgi:hypothetical protein
MRVARVAAAGRVQTERIRLEAEQAKRRAHAHAVATEWVEDLRAAGATVVGFKICGDLGKWRTRRTLEDAIDLLVSHWGGDVEAWGIDAENEFVGEVW